MRRFAWALVALTRATKEYEESMAKTLFGNLDLYEAAALDGDLTNTETRRARLVEDLDARWAATEGRSDAVGQLWDDHAHEFEDGPPAVDESQWVPDRTGIQESADVRCKLDCHAPSCAKIGLDVQQVRSCRWGKWRPTVFGGASNEGGEAAPLGPTNTAPCQHSGFYPLYCSRTWAKAQSPTNEVYAAAGTTHLFAPVLLDDDDVFKGSYSGDAIGCEEQCMLTVAAAPDTRTILSADGFEISNVTDASARVNDPVNIAAKAAEAAEVERLALERERKRLERVEEARREAREEKEKQLHIGAEAKEQTRLAAEAAEAARQQAAEVAATEAREQAALKVSEEARRKAEKQEAHAAAETAAAAKAKAAAAALALEKKNVQTQLAAEAKSKAVAEKKARIAEAARAAAAGAARLEKEAERKKKAEAARRAADEKAAAQALEGKRLAAEAKVNATRAAEETRALAAEKLAQAEAAKAETLARKAERAGKSQAAYAAKAETETVIQAKRVERAEAEAIKNANDKLEALKRVSPD